MIKAAFFDIDSTLFSHQTNSVPASSRLALKKMRQKGIKLFTATGRHLLELRQLPVKDIDFDGYVILNGQIGLNHKQELIFDDPLNPDDCQEVLAAFKQNLMPISIVEQDRIYINYIDDAVRITLKNILSPLPEIGQYHGANIYQFMTYDQGPKTRALVDKLPHCRLTQWNPLGFDIVPKTGSKLVGIEKMLAHFQIKTDEIVAFGDGDNDLEMLQHAGISVAMGNGDDKVKEISDYVTADVNHDGIYQAAVKLGII